MIIIDRISTIDTTSAGSLSVKHSITSQEVVLVVLAESGTASLTVTFNGVKLLRLISSTSPGGDAVQFYYMKNPPVGTYTLSVTGLSGGGDLIGISLLGVNKAITPVTFSTTGSTTPTSLSINSPFYNGLVIDALNVATPTTSAPDSAQTAITFADTPSFYFTNSSYKFVSNQSNTMKWNFTGTITDFTWAAIVLAPAQAPSMWFPNIGFKNNTIPTRSDTDPASFIIREKPSQFYKNSFLHTVGRMMFVNQAAPVQKPVGYMSLLGAGVT